jgi:hypothetical protein
VTVLGQGVDQVRADEAGSSNDDDSHDERLLVVTGSCRPERMHGREPFPTPEDFSQAAGLRSQ